MYEANSTEKATSTVPKQEFEFVCHTEK